MDAFNIIRSPETVEIPALTFTPEEQQKIKSDEIKFEQQYKEEKKKWLEKQFQEWKSTNKGKAAQPYFDETARWLPGSEEMLTNTFSPKTGDLGPISFYQNKFSVLSDYYEKLPTELQRNAHRDWRRFLLAKERERFEMQSPERKDFEMKVGGFLYGNDNRLEDSPLNLAAFEDKTLNRLTMGLWDSKHPVYGDYHHNYYPVWSTTGDILGELTNFMALYRVAGAAGLPAKVAQIAAGTGRAAQVARIIGTPAYFLGQYRKVLSPINTYIRGLAAKSPTYFSIAEAAGAATTTAFTRGFQQSVRGEIQKLMTEDKKSVKQYLKDTPDFIKDFVFGAAGGYALNIANSPANWSARFAADALWSAGQELIDVGTIPDRQFDFNSFAKNMIFSHVLGEAQGKIFGANKEKLLETPEAARVYNEVDRAFRGLEYSNQEAVKRVATLNVIAAEQSYKNRTGKLFTNEELSSKVNIIKTAHTDDNFYRTLNKIYYPDFTEIDMPTSFQKIFNAGEDAAYNYLSNQLHLTPKQTAEFRNAKALDAQPSRFKKLLNKFGLYKNITEREEIVSEKPLPPDPMSGQDFHDAIDLHTKKFYGRNFDDILKAADAPIKIAKAGLEPDVSKLPPAESEIARAIKEKAKIIAFSREEKLIRSGQARDQTEALRLIDDVVNSIERKPIDDFYPKGELSAKQKLDLQSLSGVDITSEKFKETYSGKFINKILNGIEKNYSLQLKTGQGKYAVRETEDVGAETGKKASDIDVATAKGYEQEQFQLRQIKPGVEIGTQDRDGMERRLLVNYLNNKPSQSRLNNVIMHLYRKDNEHRYQIAARLNAAELKPTGKSKRFSAAIVKNGLANVKNNLEKIIKDQTYTRRIEVKDQYDDADIAGMLNKAGELRSKLNPVSGLPDAFRASDFMQAQAKKNGYFVLDITEDVSKIGVDYGGNLADNAVAKIGHVLGNIASQLNSHFAQNAIRGKRLHVIHPRSANNTKFVVVGEGLDNAKLYNYASYMYKALRDNFDADADLFDPYAISIKFSPEERRIVKDFKNTSITSIRNPDDYEIATDDARAAKSIMAALGYAADKQGKRIISDMVIDYTNPNTRSALIELKNNIDLSPKTPEEWRAYFNANPYAKVTAEETLSRIIDNSIAVVDIPPPELYNASQILGVKVVDRLGSVEEREMINRRSDYLKENVDGEVLKAAEEKERYIPSQEIRDFSLAVRAGMVEQYQRFKGETSITHNIRGQENVVKNTAKRFFSSLGRFFKHNASVYEDLYNRKEAQPMISWIYGQQAQSAYRSKVTTPGIVNESYGPVFVGLETKQKDIFNKIIRFAIEEEFKQIIDEKTLKPIHTANSAMWGQEIKLRDGHTVADIANILKRGWKLTSADMKVIDSWRGDNKDIFWSKILTQIANIEPQRLIDFYITNHRTVAEPLRNMRFDGYGELKNFEFFENIKSEAGKEIKNILTPYFRQAEWDGRLDTYVNKHGKRTPFLDMDDPKAKDFLIKMSDRIVDQQFSDRMKSMVRMYYEMDPNNLSYDTHQVLGDAINQKRFLGEMVQWIRGESSGGTKKLSPIMTEMQRRKFARMVDLIRAGYDVAINGYEGQQAALNYAMSKVNNKHWANEFKTQFISNLKGAINLYQSSGDITYLKDFVWNNAGYFYAPTSSEYKYIQDQINNVNIAIEKVSKGVRDEAQIASLLTKRNALQGRIKDMDTVLSFYNGDVLKLKGTPTKFEVEQWRKAIADFYMEGIDQHYLPLNKKSFLETTKREGMEYLLSKVSTRVEEDRINSPNIPFWDGLYFHRIIHKGLNQYIFNQDTLAKKSPYDFVGILEKMWRAPNTFLKIVRLVNPAIMLNYDSQQAFKADPLYFTSLPKATKAFLNRSQKGTAISDLYWRAAKQDLFSASVSPEYSLYSDGVSAYNKSIGRNVLLGGYLDRMANSKGIGQKIWRTLDYAFKMDQETTWSIDAILRLSVFDRLSTRYLAQGETQAQADYKAGYMTNLMMIHYARAPHHTRRTMNMFAIYPTYRMQSLRADIESLRMAGRGIGLLAGLNVADEKIRMFKNPVREAMFEAGPLLRSFAGKSAVRAAMFLLFGHGYESLMDMFTGYRTRKEQGQRGTMDSSIEFFSMSGPWFEMEKLFTRTRKGQLLQHLQYNMAALPSLAMSLLTNRNMITNRPIVTASWKHEPQKAMGQLTFDVMRTFMPFGQEYLRLPADEKPWWQRLIGLSGLGQFYNTQSPRKLLEIFNRAIDDSSTNADQARAMKEFRGAMQHLSRQLFKDEYRDIDDEAQELYDQIRYRRKNQ